MYNHLTNESTPNILYELGDQFKQLQKLFGDDIIELLPEIAILYLRKTVPLLINITYALHVYNFKQLNQSAMELKTFAKQLGFDQLACWAIRLENNSLLNDRDTAVINLQHLRSEHQQISTQLQKFIE